MVRAALALVLAGLLLGCGESAADQAARHANDRVAVLAASRSCGTALDGLQSLSASDDATVSLGAKHAGASCDQALRDMQMHEPSEACTASVLYGAKVADALRAAVDDRKPSLVADLREAGANYRQARAACEARPTTGF